MIYTCTYPSPLGNILLAADEVGLTGLWFEGQKYFAKTLPKETISQETPVLIQAKKWLDVYFPGKSRILLLHFILQVPRFARLYGRSYCRSLMDRL